MSTIATSGTRTFVRGEIKEGEKFFIVLQEDHYINNSPWNSTIINYYSIRRDDAIAFTSYKDGSEPLFFTAKVKDGKIKLFVEDEPISKYNMKVSSNRAENYDSLYSGMWYSLVYEKDLKQIPWNILSLEGKELDVKANLIGSPINGYFTKREGKNERKLDGSTSFRYALIPEMFTPLDEKKSRKSFQTFKEWVLRPLSYPKGFSISENEKEWYDYEISGRNIPHKVKRGKDKWVSSNKRNSRNISFSDLEKEEKRNERRPPNAIDKFFSFFTRDNGNNSFLEEQPKYSRNEEINLSNNNNDSPPPPPPSDGGFSYFGLILAFIVGCLLTVLIVYIILSATSSSTKGVSSSTISVR